MHFKRTILNNIPVIQFMNKNLIKACITDETQLIIDTLLSTGQEAIMIMDENKSDIPEAILSIKDLLKVFNDKIAIPEYIKKYNKKTKHILYSHDTAGQALDIIMNNNIEYIPIIDRNKVIGMICSKEIFKLYNDFINKSYDMFYEILDNIHDAICVVDKESKVIIWNKSAEKLYQVKKTKILNKQIIDFFPRALLPKVIREQKLYENIYNSPRENCYDIISAKPLFDGVGLIGAVSCDVDISELKRISELLNKTQSNLQILEDEISTLNESRFSFSQIVSKDIRFKETIDFCKNIANSNINVLITGESGTGKEVFARAIHIESGRKGYFIPINCSAIPAELMESELFGYKGGAFTGALKDGKTGKFELAHEGTIFLDEIGDMPLKMQPKILRVLEDGIITRVGSEKSIKVDVRVIAATNKDLKNLMDKGLFRKDLYYRLNSITVELPPLRERKSDIPELVNKFIEDFCITYRTNIIEIPPNIMKMLIDYDWEGNIRELKNIVERVVILAKNKNIDISFLPEVIIKSSKGEIGKRASNILDLNEAIKNTEIDSIKKAMDICNYNKLQAAKLLNIPRSTLYFKLKKYNMEDKVSI